MVRVVEPLLGTRVEVEARARSLDVARTVEDAVLAEVARLERVFSVFDESSALWELRRTGSTEVDELRSVLDLASAWEERSGGAFDSRARFLFDLWDGAEAGDEVPSKADLSRAIGAARATAGFAGLDLNAMAKGWIADRSVAHGFGASTPVTSVWLSIGGDLVHRGSGEITVGIEDPQRPYDNVAPVATVDVANEALATSGGARRWWTIDGRRYPKILDPRTGQPVDQVASATVIASDGATADVLATIATIVPPDEAIDFVVNAGADCFLVRHDRSIVSTSDRFRPS